MAMLLLAVCVLMGHKVTADRGWGRKVVKGHRGEEVRGNEKEEQLWVKTYNQNPIVSHRRNYLQAQVMLNVGNKRPRKIWKNGKNC